MTIRPSKEELIEFSREHLYYEIWMLFHLAELLKSAKAVTPLHNALLESFVIHAAILIEFFYNRGSHPNDAKASDYFSENSNWNAELPSYKGNFDFITDRRNTEMAHLSYERLHVRPENKNWNVLNISLQLRKITNQFLAKADSQFLHSELYALKTEFKE